MKTSKTLAVTAKMTYKSLPDEEQAPACAPDVVPEKKEKKQKLKETKEAAKEEAKEEKDPDWTPDSGKDNPQTKVLDDENEIEIEWPCSFCQKRFQQLKFLQVHHRNKHQDQTLVQKKVFQCQECPRFFTVKKSLLNHKAKHLRKKQTVCNVCNAVFETPSELKEHVISHDLKMENPIAVAKNREILKKMKESEENVETEEIIFEHVEPQSHVSKENEMKVTDEIFNAIVESGAEPFDMEVSENEGTDSASLDESAEISLSTFFPNIVSSENNEVVAKKAGDTPAENPSAEKEDWYDEEWTCGNCPKRFAGEKFLDTHHNNKHKDLTKLFKKVYACKECPKSFAILKNLRNHRNIHANGIKCDQCGMEFNTTLKLNKHMKDFDHSLGARIEETKVDPAMLDQLDVNMET